MSDSTLAIVLAAITEPVLSVPVQLGLGGVAIVACVYGVRALLRSIQNGEWFPKIVVAEIRTRGDEARALTVLQAQQHASLVNQNEAQVETIRANAVTIASLTAQLDRLTLVIGSRAGA